MEKKIIKLLVLISRLSEQMKQMSSDLDKVFDILKEEEMAIIIKDIQEKMLPTEDFE